MPAMDEAMRAIEHGGAPRCRACRPCSSRAGGGFLGRINQGGVYVRMAPHEERTFGLGRLWRGTLHGDPMAAFRGNYSQRDVMQEVRQQLRKFRDFRILVRNIPGFNIGGGSFDIDFVLRGPDLEQLATLRRGAAHARHRHRRHRRPRHDAPPRPPGAAREHRPRARGRPAASTPSRSPPRFGSWWAATRRCRASATPRSTRTTTSSSA